MGIPRPDSLVWNLAEGNLKLGAVDRRIDSGYASDPAAKNAETKLCIQIAESPAESFFRVSTQLNLMAGLTLGTRISMFRKQQGAFLCQARTASRSEKDRACSKMSLEAVP
jgi:hypothetical protein